MNIFYLDNEPRLAAIYLVDAHVRKMVVEACQMMANAYTPEQLFHAPRTQKGTIRQHSYYNHRCSVWVRVCMENFMWLQKHADELISENEQRFGSVHFCKEFVDWCFHHRPNLKNLGYITPPAMATGNFIGDDPVTVYRDYYSSTKRFDKNGCPMDIYTNRKRPYWFHE